MPRKLSLVKFDYDTLPKGYQKYYPHFKKGERYLFLGEIIDMPGHCAVAADNGHVYFGYHTDNFVELTENEL